MKSIVSMMEAGYKSDPEKARMNRRIVTGLKETVHYVKYNKASFVLGVCDDVALFVWQRTSSIWGTVGRLLSYRLS